MARCKDKKHGGDGDAFAVDPFAALSSANLPPGPVAAEPPPAPRPALHGPVRLRLERQGRAGKAVTVLYDLDGPPAALDDLARDLRKHLGVGGTVAGDTIELQGDCRDRAAAFLRAAGHPVKGA